MDIVILDGSGDNTSAKVDAEHRLWTNSVIRDDVAEEAKKGNSYYFATDFIQLNNTGIFHGVLYMKNDSDKNIEINIIRTSSQDLAQWKMIKNPTTGTLISGGTSIVEQNMLVGSNKVSGVIAKAGADGLTVTDGAHFAQHNEKIGPTQIQLGGAIVIQPGYAIAFVCKPSIAMQVGMTILFHG